MAKPNDKSQKLPALTMAALGVVFGDIGTSPLYAMKEAFSQEHFPLLSPLRAMCWASCP